MCSFLKLILEVSWAYLKPKRIYLMLIKKVCSAIRLFQCRKNSHWENRLSRWDNFIYCHYLINEFHSQIRTFFTQNEPKFTRIEYFLTRKRISVSFRFLLLWQVNFYSKQVNSCLFWVFFSWQELGICMQSDQMILVEQYYFQKLFSEFDR